MLLLVTVFFLSLYALLIFFYFYHWLRTKEFIPGTASATHISVIVAARNEEKNIKALLNALSVQTYSPNHFEVIIVNDFSTDRTADNVAPFLSHRVQLIQPEVTPGKSSKKKAIEAGVKNAKGELIVVTDADCIPGKEWLSQISCFQQTHNSMFIAAPVKLKTNSSLLGIFQSLDFITLQGITAASAQANVHSMCNGANLAYQSSVFFEVEGFSGIDKLASGDDMLLMYKIWKKYPEGVHYLKNKKAIVETEPMHTWKDFFLQRKRWSSKASYYQDWRISLVLLFVYLFNLFFFVLLAACVYDSKYLSTLVLYVIGKLLIETPMVYAVAKFFDQQRLIIYFPFLQPLHIIYTVVVGFVSQFGTYSWKGRNTK